MGRWRQGGKVGGGREKKWGEAGRESRGTVVSKELCKEGRIR